MSGHLFPMAFVGLWFFVATGPAPRAQSQAVFSIDWHSPTVGLLDSGAGFPITPLDVLTPAGLVPAPGPLPIPSIWVSGGFGPPAPGLGIATHLPCSGVPPCVLCPRELDALSDGLERLLTPAEPPGAIWFSVDEYAVAIVGPPLPPNVATEGAFVAIDAAADAFHDLGLPPGPMPPPGPLLGHLAGVDGDGTPSFTGFNYPGLGLIEPLAAAPIPCGPGDNLDALSFLPLGSTVAYPWYFSLDFALPHPLGFPNLGTAGANGFAGGDVLVSLGPGGPPLIFAPAFLLGLDLIGGPGTDDLDGLILAENGTGVFEPSMLPYDWLGGATDMLLFSVRAESMLVGAPDSISLAPIEPGDVLTTPLVGGLTPFPGILYPAEMFGLGTVRSGTPNFFTGVGEEVDAMASPRLPVLDCNGNGIEDSLDLAFGVSTDSLNGNGVPDECELFALPYCFGIGCPCLNDDPSAGCANSLGAGALMTASGTSSVALDDLVLTTTGIKPNQFGLYYMGPAMATAAFGDGLRCVTTAPGISLYRYNPPVNSGPTGSITLGPGIAAFACGTFPPAGCIAAGSNWNFQCWYRDPPGPCTSGFNLSNAISVFFSP